jgi:hypothetical protein
MAELTSEMTLDQIIQLLASIVDRQSVTDKRGATELLHKYQSVKARLLKYNIDTSVAISAVLVAITDKSAGLQDTATRYIASVTEKLVEITAALDILERLLGADGTGTDLVI